MNQPDKMRKTKPTSQSNDTPCSTTHWSLVSLHCYVQWRTDRQTNYQIVLHQVPSQYMHSPVLEFATQR